MLCRCAALVSSAGNRRVERVGIFEASLSADSPRRDGEQGGG